MTTTKEVPFDPNSMFTGPAAVNVLRSAEEVRLDNLAKLKKTRKLGVTTMEKLKPEDVPSDDDIMKADEGKQPPAIILPPLIEATSIPKVVNTNILNCLANRIRVTFGMDSGDISIPAIDVIECNYGIMVLIPAGLTDTVFTPKPGAHVVVKAKNKQWHCFSPGTIFNLTFLDIIAVVLIMETKEAQ